MSNSNVVKLTCGVSSTETQDVIGLTVGEVRNDPFYKRLLTLNGDETATVSSNGGSFVTVDDEFVLEAGMVVQLARSGGSKG